MNIEERLEQLKSEFSQFRIDSQKKINEAMIETGVLNLINEANNKISYYQGQIDILEALIKEQDNSEKEKK